MSGAYREACAEYLRILDEAHAAGRLPPSATWLMVCDAWGLDPRENRAPKAGYLKCPVCGVSRPYALKPLEPVGVCTEWHLHPSGEAEKFPVELNWEAVKATGGAERLTLEQVATASLRVGEAKKWKRQEQTKNRPKWLWKQ